MLKHAHRSSYKRKETDGLTHARPTQSSMAFNTNIHGDESRADLWRVACSGNLQSLGSSSP